MRVAEQSTINSERTHRAADPAKLSQDCNCMKAGYTIDGQTCLYPRNYLLVVKKLATAIL